MLSSNFTIEGRQGHIPTGIMILEVHMQDKQQATPKLCTVSRSQLSFPTCKDMSTNWLTPTLPSVYIPCSCCNCRVSSALISTSLPSMQLLLLVGKQFPKQQEADIHLPVATTRWVVPSTARGWLLLSNCSAINCQRFGGQSLPMSNCIR